MKGQARARPCSEGCSQGHEWVLDSPVGEPPTWFQLPTPQDGGDTGRELSDPESKLLGRPRGWAGLLATAQARRCPPHRHGGAHSQPAARDTLPVPAQPQAMDAEECPGLQATPRASVSLSASIHKTGRIQARAFLAHSL